MSNLLVQNIKHTNGTLAETVDSNGYVLTPNRPSFYAYPSADFECGTGSGTTRIFGETLHNQGGHYSTSTGRFTAPVAGLYFFHSNIATASETNVIVYMSAEVSATLGGVTTRFGGGWSEKDSSTNTHHKVSNTVILEMAVGDYAMFSHESNVSLTILGTSSGSATPRYTYFMGYLIG